MARIKICKECGKEFEIHRRGNYQICPECKQKRREVKQIKECDICGQTFKATHGNQQIWPECAAFCIKGQRRHIPNSYEPKLKFDEYETHIRLNAIERAKHNDNIIGEGYAERQIEDTLSKVEPIKTEL